MQKNGNVFKLEMGAPADFWREMDIHSLIHSGNIQHIIEQLCSRFCAEFWSAVHTMVSLRQA